MNSVQEFFDKCAPTWDENRQSLSSLKNTLSSIDINKGDNVLDLGCGTGVITSLLYEKCQCDIDALDISSKMIEIANKNNENPHIHFINEDLYNFNSSAYDKIVLFNAYPHFLDLVSFKDKIYSLLKPNGVIYILHDCSREELNSHHQAHAKGVSRILANPELEGTFYQDKFKIIEAKENSGSYHLFLRKEDNHEQKN